MKSYKLKRLAFTNDRKFWTYWKDPHDSPLSYFQLVYKMATAMSLARFNVPEMLSMLIGWHKKHDFKIDYLGLQSVIRDTRKFTLAEKRERKRLEMRRYRAKQKLMAVPNGR